MSSTQTTFRVAFEDAPLPAPRTVVCHCLNITAGMIATAVDAGAAQTVKDIIRETGAGSGCTACHCTIRALLKAAGCPVRCGGSIRYAPSPQPAVAAG